MEKVVPKKVFRIGEKEVCVPADSKLDAFCIVTM